MMAAGWGGSGRVLHQSESGMELRQDVTIARKTFRKILPMRLNVYRVRMGAFTGEEREIIVGEHLVTGFIEALNNLHSSIDSKIMPVITITELKSLGLPKDIVHELTVLKNSGVDENIIVVLFLYALTKKKRFREAMSKQLRRLIIKMYKELPKFDETIKVKIETVSNRYH
jgi:hypothetical protein